MSDCVKELPLVQEYMLEEPALIHVWRTDKGDYNAQLILEDKVMPIPVESARSRMGAMRGAKRFLGGVIARAARQKARRHRT